MTTNTQAQPDLAAYLRRVVRSGDDLLATLEALASPSRHDAFFDVVARIDSMAKALDSVPGRLSTAESRMWLERFETLTEAWAQILDELDRTVALAIAHAVERGVLRLLPIANCADVTERRRLRDVSRRLADALESRDEPESNDPDIRTHGNLTHARALTSAPLELSAGVSTDTPLEIEVLLDPTEPQEIQRIAAFLFRIGENEHPLAGPARA